jgi:hypothetical protein
VLLGFLGHLRDVVKEAAGLLRAQWRGSGRGERGAGRGRGLAGAGCPGRCAVAGAAVWWRGGSSFIASGGLGRCGCSVKKRGQALCTTSALQSIDLQCVYSVPALSPQARGDAGFHSGHSPLLRSASSRLQSIEPASHPSAHLCRHWSMLSHDAENEMLVQQVFTKRLTSFLY